MSLFDDVIVKGRWAMLRGYRNDPLEIVRVWRGDPHTSGHPSFHPRDPDNPYRWGSVTLKSLDDLRFFSDNPRYDVMAVFEENYIENPNAKPVWDRCEE